jgi:uncharacterized protein involved in exopolysaccharide biosynthesis
MQTKIADQGNVDVVSLIEVLWRYRWAVIACTLLGIGASLYLALTARWIYQADVVVTQVNENANGLSSLTGSFGGLASLAGINLGAGNSSTIEAQTMLQSRFLAERFIEKHKLQAALGGSPDATLWKAVDNFRRGVVKVSQQKEKGTMTVSVRWRDPKQAAEWANQYVALANDIMRNRALEESNRNIKFLNEKLATTSVLEVQRVMYSLIENEAKNHMLASTRSEYAFSVIDPAVTPEERVWPRRGLMLITGTVIGFVLGAFLALVFNFWQRRAEQRLA